MDRRENSKTITIKINGQKRQLEENKERETEKTINNKAQHDRIEIRKQSGIKNEYSAANESAAAKEAEEDEQFEWILPDDIIETETEQEEYSSANQPIKKLGKGTIIKNNNKEKRNRILPSIFLTVFFAVLLGTSFGFIMLKLVITEKAPALPGTEPAASVPQPAEEMPAAGETVTIELEDISTFVIQGGVFSNKEAAAKIQKKNISKGAPTQLLEINGQSVLYLGVADNLDNAKKMAADYKSNEVDAFAKSITIDGKTIEGLLPEEKKILEAVPHLYEAIVESTANAAGTEAVNIEKEAGSIKDIKTEQLKNKEIITIKKELDSAVQQINKYKQSPDSDTLKEIQQHLLRFIAAYQAL